MAENTNNSRSVTISLDEYLRLKETSDSSKSEIGALKNEISNLKEKQAQVKITHYNSSGYFPTIKDHYEWINMTEIHNLAKEGVKADYENQLENHKEQIKKLKGINDDQSDIIDSLRRSNEKEVNGLHRSLADNEDNHRIIVKDLNKAYEKDVKYYKEKMNDLNEEIQKLKDSKSDAEVEKKRNEEITTLKLRIRDLEKTINALRNVKRVSQIRKFTNELDKDRIAAAQREREADNIGKTWVKEGGKFRKFDYFKDAITSMFGRSQPDKSPIGRSPVINLPY